MSERIKHSEIMEKLKRCSEDIKRLIEIKARAQENGGNDALVLSAQFVPPS
jgi:hypothetical protein